MQKCAAYQDLRSCNFEVNLYRPGELLSSLFVRRSSVNISHFNLPQKPLGQLQPNFGGMVLVWPPSKIVSGDPDFQLRWPPS